MMGNGSYGNLGGKGQDFRKLNNNSRSMKSGLGLSGQNVISNFLGLNFQTAVRNWKTIICISTTSYRSGWRAGTNAINPTIPTPTPPARKWSTA